MGQPNLEKERAEFMKMASEMYDELTDPLSTIPPGRLSDWQWNGRGRRKGGDARTNETGRYALEPEQCSSDVGPP